MPEIFILNSIREVSRDTWNQCFIGEIENYDYLLAIEDAGIKGFAWRYITAWQYGNLIAAMPAFLNDYSLDTTVQGLGKKITDKIQTIFPHILKIKLASLGSPCTEAGVIGFHPDVNDAGKTELLQKMLLTFEDFAQKQKCRLIGIKDIPQHSKALWDRCLSMMQYTSLYSLPTAYLDINFKTIDEYFQLLSSSTRKSMRRKLKAKDKLRIEHRTNIDDLLPQILSLYHDTRNRSEFQFEELTENYFHDVLGNMNGRSFCTLYYADEKLLAANLLIHDNKTLIDKFFCMNSDEGREYNLYFLSWFSNIEYCLKHGLTRYQSGQAYYENKVSLGSTLTNNWMYFKHSNFIVQSLLKFIAPKLMANDSAESFMKNKTAEAA